MQTKKWVKQFFISSVFVIVTVSAINLVINPYNVFGTGLDFFVPKKPESLSDRMSKPYIANRIKPVTIMMGTSRIGLFPETQLSPYLGVPAMNLSMAGSTIDEQAAYIRYMVRKGFVKNVVWSLDFFAFNPTKPIDPAYESKRLEDTPFMDDYLISLFSFKTLARSFKTVKKNLFIHPEADTLGQPFSEKQVEFNIHYILNQYATEPTFLKSESFKTPSSIDPKIEIVRDTIQYCHQHNVNCFLYTSPVYYRHIDMIYSIGLGDTFEYWKKELVGITPYFDFCTYSSLSKETMNFRDSSHVIGKLGEQVFARIFSNNDISVPSDFGILLTPQNIDSHLKMQRNLVQPFSLAENASYLPKGN